MAQFGSSTLFISHDISVVAYFSDQIAVLYQGTLMELVPTQELASPPIHPYTELLLSTVPASMGGERWLQPPLEAKSPDLLETITGCPFHPRCHRKIGEICERDIPAWQRTGEELGYRCHITVEELMQLQNDLEGESKDKGP
jgi:peptide/nickel transport system ATP-binding protein